MKDVMAKPMKMKPMLCIDGDSIKNIEDLNLGDDVIVMAMGKIKRLASNNYDGKEKYSCDIEMSGVEVESISSEDRKEADEMGISDMKKFKKIKDLRNKVKEKYER